MLLFINRSSIALSLGCYYVADRNSKWEKQLKKEYSEWLSAHEEYRKYAHIDSKFRYKIDSSGSFITAVKKVNNSYSDMNREIVMNLLKQGENYKWGRDDDKSLFSDLYEDDCIALNNPDTSVEERESILKTRFGLNNYKAFKLAMASSKESTARDKLLSTFYEKPFTLLTEEEDSYLWNTRYLFYASFFFFVLFI